jgi:hypothetical protein
LLFCHFFALLLAGIRAGFFKPEINIKTSFRVQIIVKFVLNPKNPL